jgi:branched-subunit amino acid ABC-type transport system permease component
MVGAFSGQLIAAGNLGDSTGLPADVFSLVAWVLPLVLGALCSGFTALLCYGLVYRPLLGRGRHTSLCALCFAVLFIVLLWKPISDRSIAAAAGALGAGMALILVCGPRLRGTSTEDHPRAGRNVALQAALALSLALQHGVALAFTANHRPWPTPHRRVAIDEIDNGPSSTSVYRVRDGIKEYLFKNGQPTKSFDPGSSLAPDEVYYREFPLDDDVVRIIIFTTTLIAAVGLYCLVHRTAVGKAMRATATQPEAARLVGIAPGRIIALAFLVGGLLAGATGVLYGMRYNRVEPYMGFLPGLKAFIVVLLGGVCSFTCTVIV